MTSLSVIVPCYNCETTLSEAVASIFAQSPGIPFDVTMVDDGSTDATYAVMQALASKYPRVRLVRHQGNQGGGAARNTAVAHSAGDLIFCLDSDDILGPDFLRNMVRFWFKRRSDAVGMSTSIKFRGPDTSSVAYVTDYERPGKEVRFESFLEGPRCSLSVVFMMTRRAFLKVGGYPTEHGFDTQGMAMRFLCNGLTAYTCPDTRYFHRVERADSYYMREYSAGRLNWNWLWMLDEHLYIFSSQVKDQLLRHDLFAVPGQPEPPPLQGIVRGRRGIYARGYRNLVRLGRHGVARKLRDSEDRFDQYWLGSYFLARGELEKASHHFQRALSAGFRYRIIYLKLLQMASRASGSDQKIGDLLTDLQRYSEPVPEAQMPLRQRLFQRMIRSRHWRRPALQLKGVVDRLRGTGARQ
jgi:glycosyltransferase involved in cell wall biosynthesis